MNIGIIGASAMLSKSKVAVLLSVEASRIEAEISERKKAHEKIRLISIAAGLSEEEFCSMIMFLDRNKRVFVDATEAAEKLIMVLKARSIDKIPETFHEPKKPVFFQRDIIPSRKRRFGTN